MATQTMENNNNVGGFVTVASPWQQQCKKEKKLCDMVLYGGDAIPAITSDTSPLTNGGSKGIFCHKIILGNIEYFRNLIMSSDEDQKEFTIPDIPTNTLDIFVEYMYTGKLSVDIKLSNVTNMLVGAKKFQQEEMIQKCENLIKANINIEKCSATFRLAYSLDSKVLMEASTEYILSNIGEVRKTDGFFQLSHDHMQAIIKQNRNDLCPSTKLMGIIIQWAGKDTTKKKKHVGDLLTTLYDIEEDTDMRSQLFKMLVRWIMEFSQQSGLMSGANDSSKNAAGSFFDYVRTPPQNDGQDGQTNEANLLQIKPPHSPSTSITTTTTTVTSSPAEKSQKQQNGTGQPSEKKKRMAAAVSTNGPVKTPAQKKMKRDNPPTTTTPPVSKDSSSGGGGDAVDFSRRTSSDSASSPKEGHGEMTRRTSTDSSSSNPVASGTKPTKTKKIVIHPPPPSDPIEDKADVAYFVAGNGRRLMSYNLMTQKTELVSSIPVDTPPIHGNRSVCYWNNKVFILGGIEKAGKSSKGLRVLEMENEAKVWRDKSLCPDMIDGRVDFHCVFLDDCLYVVGGCQMGFGLGFVERLFLNPPKSWKFERILSMNRPRNNCGVTVLEGQIYAVGGKCLQGQGVNCSVVTISSMEVYSPNTNKWSTVKALMKKGRWGVCAVAAGRNIYALGGTQDAQQPYKKLSDVEVYSLDTDKWITTTSMNKPRAFGAAAYSVHSDSIYCIGGDDGEDGQKTVEVFDIKANKWTTLPGFLPQDGNFSFIGFTTL